VPRRRSRDRRQRERDAATSPTSPQADFAVPPAGEEPGEDESDGEADSGPDGNGGASGSDGNESRGSGSDDDD
jgi:hypothetical protein